MPGRNGVTESPARAAAPGKGVAQEPSAADIVPLVDLDTLFPEASGRVLVLAPEPGSEALGCGGLLAALAEAGRPARVVVVSDGGASDPASRTDPPDRLRARCREETVTASLALGCPPSCLAFLGLPHGGVPDGGPGFDAAVLSVANLARRDPLPPGAVLASCERDDLPDHAAVAAMGRAVAADLGCRALFYQCWGSRPRRHPPVAMIPAPALRGPGRETRLDITPMLDRKRRAVEAHRSHILRPIAENPEDAVPRSGVTALSLRPFESFTEEKRAGSPPRPRVVREGPSGAVLGTRG